MDEFELQWNSFAIEDKASTETVWTKAREVKGCVRSLLHVFVLLGLDVCRWWRFKLTEAMHQRGKQESERPIKCNNSRCAKTQKQSPQTLMVKLRNKGIRIYERWHIDSDGEKYWKTAWGTCEWITMVSVESYLIVLSFHFLGRGADNKRVKERREPSVWLYLRGISENDCVGHYELEEKWGIAFCKIAFDVFFLANEICYWKLGHGVLHKYIYIYVYISH